MKPKERKANGLITRSAARRVPSGPAGPAADGADAGRIADTAVATWRGVDDALSPIIGPRAVAALYQRSLHLARARYPWLATAHEGALEPGEFANLQTALSRQTGASAAAANRALLQTFHALLTRLIGGSLTERLLGSVCVNP